MQIVSVKKMIIKYLIFIIVLSIFLPAAFASSFSATVIKEIIDTDNYYDSDVMSISNDYLVSRDFANKALNIWDISDPLNPVFSHSALVGFDNYNRMAGGNNFIVIPKDNTLYIIDMTDKNNIFFRANFTSTEKGILVSANNRLLDDEENVFYILNGGTLSIFDITDKDNPVKRGVLSHPSLSNINSPNIIVGNYLYLTDQSITTKNNYPGNENFAVVDISNLDTPTFVTAIADSRLHQMGGSVFVEDQNILMLTMAFGGGDDKTSVITAVDISDPENPIVTSTTTNSLLYREITFFKFLDNNLYGITAGLSLIKVDISNISDIKITGIDKFGTYADFPYTVFDEVNNIMYISQYSLHKLLVVGISFPDTITITHKKNGGGCSDCTPPTLGLDKTYKRVVDNGFSYNGNMVQVEKWYTDFPLINATVGIPNLVEIKVYENHGINNMKWVQFCLGAEERGQPLNFCEVLIEVHLSTNGTTTGIDVREIVINDKDNLIDNDTVTAVSYVTLCMDDSLSSNCVKVDLEYTYREETLNHMMVVNVADKPRNSQNFHFNEGVNVLGESVNESPTITLSNKHASQQKDNLYITYTRIDKIDDTWVDQFGIEYHRINDVTFDRITPADSYECKDPTLDKVKVWKRTNCHFRDLTSLWSYN